MGRRRSVPARRREQPRARGGGRHDLLLLDRRLRHLPVRLPVRQPVRRRRRRHEHVLDERPRPRCSTTTTWSGGGSWCSNIVARPVVADRRRRDGQRAVPGPRDPGRLGGRRPEHRRPLHSTARTPTGGTPSGQVGGTSLAAPVMNGLRGRDRRTSSPRRPTRARRRRSASTAPVLYQLGNSGHSDSYYRDVQCGNTANPTSGPDGDAASRGWDAATGWGEPDWFNFAPATRITLGATNLSVPASLSPDFALDAARRRRATRPSAAISCPSTSTVLRGRRRLGRDAVVRQVPRRAARGAR